jgi:hypothetical protein
MEIDKITRDLSLNDGIWFSKTLSKINYPEKGNSDCVQLEDSSFWFKHRNNCIKELIRKFSSDKVFFDIGGGNGFVSLSLQQNGINTVLLEPGLEGCLNAKKRGIRNIICSSVEEAGILNESIQSLGIFDVLEHIDDDKSFLVKLYSLLVKSGYLYITVPAYNFLWSAEDEYARHFRRYSLPHLSDLLDRAGFKVIYKTYIFSFLPLPVFLFRSLPRRLKSSRNQVDMKKMEREHGDGAGLGIKLINKICSWELDRINRSKSMPFGGSCLIVARRA